MTVIIILLVSLKYDSTDKGVRSNLRCPTYTTNFTTIGLTVFLSTNQMINRTKISLNSLLYPSSALLALILLLTNASFSKWSWWLEGSNGTECWGRRTWSLQNFADFIANKTWSISKSFPFPRLKIARS